MNKKILSPFLSLFKKNKTLVFYLLIFTLIALGVSFQNYLSGVKEIGGGEYTHYNNYIIFKNSHFHLKNGSDLYSQYGSQWDLYKYSPTFAFLMGGIVYFPNLLGLSIWNIINTIFLVLGIWYLPKIDFTSKRWMLVLISIELITSIQNSQSNGLIAALLIWTFIFLEKANAWKANICLVLSIFIKIFGVVLLPIYLFYKFKVKAAVTFLLICLAFFLLPLIIISPEQLYQTYQSWFKLLMFDHDTSIGYSIAGIIESFFNIPTNKNAILFVGLIILLLPIKNYKFYDKIEFRLLYLANILIWIVIFNHKAESPTFIISVSGVVIWYFLKKRNYFDLGLLILTIILTSLSVTDLTPKIIKESYVIEYKLKALPCLLVWLKISYELLFFQSKSTTSLNKHHHQLSN